MSVDIDNQIKKAEERVKQLKAKKIRQEAKKAIADNIKLKEALKNSEAEKLAISREYQEVMKNVKQLFDNLQSQKKSTIPRQNQQGETVSVEIFQARNVLAGLKKIIDLQK